MAEYIGSGGAWKGIQSQYIGASGAWKVIQNKWIGAGGVWKLIFSALTVTASDVTKSQTGLAQSATVTSNVQTVVTATGGSGTYSYSYALQSYTGAVPSLSSGGTTASPRFSATITADTATQTGESNSVWLATVTDTASGATATAQFNVTLVYSRTV